MSCAEISEEIKFRNINTVMTHIEEARGQGQGYPKRAVSDGTRSSNKPSAINASEVNEAGAAGRRKSLTPECLTQHHHHPYNHNLHQPHTATTAIATTTALVHNGTGTGASAHLARHNGDSPSRIAANTATNNTATTTNDYGDSNDSPKAIKRSSIHHTTLVRSTNNANSLSREFLFQGHDHHGGSLPGSPISLSQKNSPTSAHGPSYRPNSTSMSKEFQAVLKMSETQQEIQGMLSELLSRVNGLQKSQSELSTQQSQQQYQLQQMNQQQQNSISNDSGFGRLLSKDWLLIAVILVFQLLLQCYFSGRS